MFLRINKLARWVAALLFFINFSWILFAEGEEHGEAAKPAEGHGEAGKEDGKAGAQMKSPEWMELNNSLQTVRTKIKSKEEIIHKLISEKAHIKNSAQASNIVKQMVKEHKEMQKAIGEYEEKRNLLRYRFPEAGLVKERAYERLEGKSLESIENQWNLENKIKSSVKNIKEKYGVKSENETQVSKPATKVNEVNPLAEPMIISK